MRALPLLITLTCGCGQEPALSPTRELHAATDTNPDPRIVEVTLVATHATVELETGRATDVLAYRDGAVEGSPASIPGPMTEASQGDRLIVHFRNELDRETSVHWHGLRLPVDMDGVSAIAPGATFDFDFVLRDAGLHWYHPHINSDEQVELGLQGTLRVRGADEPRITTERVFVLDDVDLDERGAIVIEPSRDDLVHGRRGNTLLVNGRAPGFVTAAAGAVERWRIVNTSNGRFFDVHAGLRLRVIGWDGGLIPEPYDVDHLLIGPGERYDVVVALDGTRGDEIRLETLEVPRGHGMTDPGPLELVRFRLDGSTASPVDIPTTRPSLSPLPVTTQTAARRFALTEDIDGPAGAVFFMNGQRWPLNTPVDVRLGDVEIWEIVNETDGDHPVHVHGHFLQVLDRDGAPAQTVGLKDTVTVGPRETVRAAIRYDEPGRWMFHCQIPEHAERGMMADVDVEP